MTFFEHQRKVVLAKLGGKQARKGTRHWSPVPTNAKAVGVDKVFDSTRWDSELEDLVSGMLTLVFNERGDEMFAAFDVDGAFNLRNPGVTKAFGRRVNKVSGINATTRDSIRAQLQAGEAAGESIKDLAARVGDVFDMASGYRATMIARTETNGAVNEADHLAAGQAESEADLKLVKEWVAIQDDRTRDSHAEIDGEKVGLDETFGNGLAYPGDEAGDAGEVVNCRCTLVYEDTSG